MVQQVDRRYLQVQMSATPEKISELLHSIQSRVCDVNSWAIANMLRLKDNMKVLMLVTSKRTKHLHNYWQCSNFIQTICEESESYIRL